MLQRIPKASFWIRMSTRAVTIPGTCRIGRLPEEYPSVEHTCDGAWRWEFIRRNPTYRRVWLAYQSNQDAWHEARSEGDTRVEQVARWFQLEGLYSPACHHKQFIVPMQMVSSLYDITPAFQGDMSQFCKRAARKGSILLL